MVFSRIWGWECKSLSCCARNLLMWRKLSLRECVKINRMPCQWGRNLRLKEKFKRIEGIFQPKEQVRKSSLRPQFNITKLDWIINLVVTMLNTPMTRDELTIATTSTTCPTKITLNLSLPSLGQTAAAPQLMNTITEPRKSLTLAKSSTKWSEDNTISTNISQALEPS